MTEHHPPERSPSHTSHEVPSHLAHKSQGVQSLACMVITCSDTRTTDSDTSGKLICHLLKERGHSIVDYRLIKDDPGDITNLLQHTADQTKIRRR